MFTFLYLNREHSRSEWREGQTRFDINMTMICAGPFIKDRCTNCFRVILYLGDNKLVVHNQQINTPGNEISIGYSSGNYFREDQFNEAMACFTRRMGDQIGLTSNSDN